MATPTQMEIRRDEIVQIVESVFREMLGLDAIEFIPPADHREAGRADDSDVTEGVDQVVACVGLKGDWNGRVMVACKARQACFLAGRFLSIPDEGDMDAPPRVDDVTCDVVGELANMIGGNLKCILARGIKLSTPVVTYGVRRHPEEDDEYAATEVFFRCQGGVFSVAVLAAL